MDWTYLELVEMADLMVLLWSLIGMMDVGLVVVLMMYAHDVVFAW